MHSRLSRTKVETTVYHLPRPNRHHLDCPNALLATVEREQGLSTSDRVAQSGSMAPLSGFGLKFANVNLDLQITADQKPHLVLLKALEVLHDSPDSLEVADEFTAKIPAIK
jgi:hypothetical protein